MLRSYLLLAWRSLIRQKAYALINVVGLAIGVACCVVALVFVRHELSYDRFHEKGDRIYRIVHQGVDDQGMQYRSAVTPAGYAPHMLQDFPQIEGAVRVWNWSGRLRWGDRRLNGQGILFADPGIAPYAGAGLIALGSAIASVSLQALRAARTNPVDALRCE